MGEVGRRWEVGERRRPDLLVAVEPRSIVQHLYLVDRLPPLPVALALPLLLGDEVGLHLVSWVV